MDPLGHASIGLMVKPFAPKIPLWSLLAATQIPDLLFFGFQAAGIEHQAVTQFDLDHGLQYISPPTIVWSHGLGMCIVWSILLAVVAFLFCRDHRTSMILGLVLFSHWGLDSIVYPLMPVFFDNSQTIGLGLLTSVPGLIVSVILEIGLIVGGIAAYWMTRQQTALFAQK
ncbi:MAG: hypothetical protein HZB51_24360 [Chloroflexi bacterium]|nr:hypothetical protein [Chloroflexota bacterium]